jgi:hypothetical protein
MVKIDSAKQGAGKTAVRAEKHDIKKLPWPTHWKSLARTNPGLYSFSVWKSLSKNEQAEKIAQLRPAQHRLLHLCHSNFPPDFAEAWDALSDVGTST